MTTDLKQISKELRENSPRIGEMPVTIFHLVRKINKGDLILPSPTKVWADKRKSEYIESIYLNYPLAWFYSQKLDTGEFLMKRGIERALTILEYFDGTLKLTGLKRLSALQNYSLDEIQQKDDWLYNKFTERKITLYVSFSELSPKDSDEFIRRSLWT